MENTKGTTKIRRFEAVSLSFNVGGQTDVSMRACPDGGSACHPATDCGGVSNDCNGPSCAGATGLGRFGFDARILIERSRLEALQAELKELVAGFVR